jgi:ABC-type branched-subunit amino acid transport system substrate-binding protein
MCHTICFETISSIQHCAASLDASRLPENKDWLNPSYEKWYQSAFNTTAKRLGYSFFSISPTCFDLLNAKQVFVSIIEQKQKQDFSLTDFTEISIDKSETYYLIGGLFGDFHGLLLIIEELKQRGVINENLQITGNNHIIFLGNVIDYSPYSFETLLAVASLMHKNPTNCLYIRAQHEHKQYWYSHTFKHQLLAFDRVSWNKQESWISLITAFFDTLPQGIIFKSSSSKNSIMVSSQNEALANNPHALLLMSTPDSFFSAQEDRLNGFEGFEKGIPTWSLLSSNNAILRNYFSRNTLYFAQLTIEPTIANSSATYFAYNDSDSKFEPTKTINVQMHVNTFAFGSTMDSSKGVSFQGTAVKAGIESSFNRINQSGGLNKRFLRLVTLDDQYNPTLARKQALSLLNDFKISQLLCSIGSPTIESYLDLIKEKKMYLFFPVTGAEFLRKQELEAIIHFRVSYPTEVRALLKNVVAENKKNIVLLYQDDAFGISALKAAQEFTQADQSVNLIPLPYTANSTQFDNIIEQLNEKEYDALGFFATAFATQEFIRQLGIEKLVSKKMFGISDLSELSFQRFLKDQGLSCLVTFVVPPIDATLPIIQEYRSTIGASDSDNRPYVLEGFIAAEIIVDALKQLDINKITPQALMEHLQTYNNYNFKGLKLTFNAQTRELNSTVWLYDGKTFTEEHATT